jgi:predicted nucleic acid-binding protein
VPVFVDTNVLVYARDLRDRGKYQRATDWMTWLWSSGEGRIGTQVLQEYYVTVTRKLQPSMRGSEAADDVRDLWTWAPVAVDRDVLELGWDVERRFRLSFWDALVVAAAEIAGCDRLLTEDLHEGATYGSVLVVDPFSTEPG